MKNEHQETLKRENGTLRVMSINNEKSMTQQQFEKECDINNIMRKYQTIGEFTHLTKKGMMYGDFSEIQDYQAMLDKINYAQDAFMALPAMLRKRFDNDPGQLLRFIQDKNNYEEAVKLGLVETKTEANNADEIKTTTKKASKNLSTKSTKISTDPQEELDE